MKLKDNVKQFVMYLIVGGLATVVEWVVFYILGNLMSVHYMGATAIAFIISTFANWLFGRIILFGTDGSAAKELVQVYIISIGGLVLNLLIMWVAVSCIKIDKMLSKIIATGIVFFWNFL